MADIKNLEGMIDSTPIMKDFADIESSKLPEYQIDSKIPEGPIAEKWTNYKAHQKLVNPWRDGLQRAQLLHPGLTPPRSLYRCTGWYQCSQELPERR